MRLLDNRECDVYGVIIWKNGQPESPNKTIVARLWHYGAERQQVLEIYVQTMTKAYHTWMNYSRIWTPSNQILSRHRRRDNVRQPDCLIDGCNSCCIFKSIESVTCTQNGENATRHIPVDGNHGEMIEEQPRQDILPCTTDVTARTFCFDRSATFENPGWRATGERIVQ